MRNRLADLFDGVWGLLSLPWLALRCVFPARPRWDGAEDG